MVFCASTGEADSKDVYFCPCVSTISIKHILLCLMLWIRWSADATRANIYDALTTSENYLTPLVRMDKQCVNSVFEEKGLHLISKGKVATVLVVTNNAKEASDPAILSKSLVQTLDCINQKLVKVRFFVQFLYIEDVFWLNISIGFFKLIFHEINTFYCLHNFWLEGIM